MLSQADAVWIFEVLAQTVARSSMVRHSGERLDLEFEKTVSEIETGKIKPPNPARKKAKPAVTQPAAKVEPSEKKEGVVAKAKRALASAI